MVTLNACCFCLPLRTGLMIWAYLGLISSYVTTLRMLFIIQDILRELHYFNPTSFTGLTLLFILSILHLLFYILFVAALHKKSRGLLEFFNGYNVFMLIGFIIAISLYLPTRAYNLRAELGVYVYIYVILGLISLGLTILLQLYLIIAVRSLISELEDEKDCSTAVYPSDDPECIIHKFNDYLEC